MAHCFQSKQAIRCLEFSHCESFPNVVRLFLQLFQLLTQTLFVNFMGQFFFNFSNFRNDLIPLCSIFENMHEHRELGRVQRNSDFFYSKKQQHNHFCDVHDISHIRDDFQNKQDFFVVVERTCYLGMGMSIQMAMICQ